MKRTFLFIIVSIILQSLCFAQMEIKVGNLSYSIEKNTKPAELMPAAVAYQKAVGGHIISARFPGYDYFAPVNGSGWYTGWSGDANEITGVITVTSPRGYTYTFDNGSDPNNKEGMELKLTEIKDPNGNFEGIFSYYSNGSLNRITENSNQDSVYMQFGYDGGRLLSITAFDPSAVAGSNYSRVYNLVYDSNDRVVFTTSSTSGCGCSGTGSDWLTDVYDVNNRLVDQNDSSGQTIYSYNYHSDGTLHEKRNKDGNLIKNIEFADLIDGTRKRKTYDYVDPYNYRYSEKIIDIDGSIKSDTVFRELRDTRVDPNLYDSNSFTTRYLYEGDDETVIPDGEDPDGDGISTIYDYDESHNLISEDQYDSNHIGRTIVSNNYSNDRLSDTTDIRGNRIIYEYIENSSLLYKQNMYDFDYYYRYIYDDQNRKVIEEIRQDDASANDEDDPIVQTTYFEYDKYGNVSKEYRNNISDRSEPNSFVTEYVYNAFGNLLWQINPDGSVSGKTYDAAGRVENEFVLAGGIAVFSQIENPLNLDLNGLEVVSQTNYQYHSVYGKIEVVSVAVDSDVFNLNSPEGWNATLYGYDSYGRKISETKDYTHTNIITAYQYNRQDELEVITYSDEHTEETVRDGRGLTVQTIKSGGSESITTDYAYDNRGNLIQTKIADTIVNSLQYDDYGRKITSFNGDFNDVHFTQYIYDGTTDDIETVKVWDIDTNNDPVIIKRTFKAYDLSGRIIFEQQFADPSLANGLNDKITFYRYDVLGNLIMTAYKGVGNSWNSIYDYYPDTYGGYDGDIIELRKYNGNLQLSAVMKFEYPQIPDMYYDAVLQDYVYFFDSNLADTEFYILQNDPNIYYIKYDYINSQLANQSLYTGIDSNTNELTFSKKTSYDYDLAGRTTRAYDADDNFTSVKYNSYNQPTEQILWQGKNILRFSDSNGYDPSFVPYPVRTSLTEYNNLGSKIKTAVLYDPNSINDINGIDDVNLAVDKVISYVYDANGNLYREKEIFGKSEYGDDRISLKEYSYDSLGRVSLVLYSELQECYFGSQFLGESIIPLKYITYGYNDMGHMDTQTVTDVNTIDFETTAAFDTHYEYDNQGRVREIQNAIGILGQYFYDTIGRKVKEVDFAGMVTINNYNGLGYLTSTVEDANHPQPRTTTFGYDRNGRRTSISSVNEATVYTYNYLDKVTSITYPDDKEIFYGYDMEGNVIRRTITENSTSVTTNYKRDIMGRVCYKQYSNDPNWNDPNTFWPFDEILYDAAGNKWLMANIDDGNDSEFVCFMYDGLGNMSSSNESYPEVNYEVSYGYDSRGLLKTIQYPNQKIVSYTRDALGRVETVSYDANAIAHYYYLGDKVIKKTIGGIEYTANIDSLGRIESEGYGGLTFDYGYLNHTSRLTSRNTVDYIYDTLGRVTYEESTNYTCDLLGNPANAGNDGLTYTLDNEDRVIDVNDTSGDVAQYSYDRTGRRTSKTVGEVKTYFTYDKSGNIIAEYIRDGNETVWNRDYVYGANGELIYMDFPLVTVTETTEEMENFINFCDAWLCSPDCTTADLEWDYNSDSQINFIDYAAYMDEFEVMSDNSRHYVLTDYHNSVVGISDGSSIIEIAYNAWGIPSYTGDLDGLNILWNGYYSDEETGNYYLRNRYYSPLERKFVTEDPRGINPDGNWNNRLDILGQYRGGYGLMVYAGGDSINSRDDWGLKTIGTKIGLLLYSRMLTGAIINRFRADEYTLNDDEEEMIAALEDSMDTFYASQIYGNRGKANFDVENASGKWEINSSGLFDTGWWLHGAQRVSAKGHFDYCCEKRVCKLTNVSVDWDWYDDIDAHDFIEALNVYEQGSSEWSWLERRLASIGLSIESFWDLIGDKAMDTDFKVNVKWKETRKEPIRIVK